MRHPFGTGTTTRAPTLPPNKCGQESLKTKRPTKYIATPESTPQPTSIDESRIDYSSQMDKIEKPYIHKNEMYCNSVEATKR
jgi:hypothetical protein